jgi:hypothetical protein
LSSKAEPTQEDFDMGVIAKDLPFEWFEGVKVQIPNVAPGTYTVQFQWFWPTGAAAFLFSTCSDIEIVTQDQIEGRQSNRFGYGLPKVRFDDMRR